jgi:ubiquinone/menaquinone biosynthesis C-methylase UbiE
LANNNVDRMSDLSFRLMSAVMSLRDLLFPYIDKRVEGFGISPGMTIVDYGCGPGRYSIRFAELVGENGIVYAVDVQGLALEFVKKKAEDQRLNNIVPVLAQGYHTDIPDHAADKLFVLDMIFGVKEPAALLAELHRIARQDASLILDDGHQLRHRTIQMIHESGKWGIQEESKDHIRCLPLKEIKMEPELPYSMNLDVKYGPLELVDVQALVDACQDQWYNQTLSRVNDCVVRLGVMQGEFHWHKHDDQDEFFYVVEGRFVIDLEDRTVELASRQGYTIPKGVVHRTRAPERTVILMIEGAGVIPTGDK